MKSTRGVLLILLLELLAFTSDFDTPATNQKSGSSDQDSAVLKRMFREDQADRNVDDDAMTDQQRSEWRTRLRTRDDQRHKEVMDLVKRGELQTGVDFEEAAVIFQHGLDPDDYLLAHTLAIIAVAKGRSQSRWLVAATLDRYLHKMKQQQIYGTESLGTPYKSGPKTTYNWTQDPYNRALIPDRLRAELCVPDLPQQERALQLLNEGKDSPERTNGPGCL
jgi:hypothetical protein